ncbi:MAG: Rrf2 family transcriptional regulator [Chloroflexi bacterium]|nr:Rrf2 family transcriptional regulator [Chloroflexota bacterium]
MFKINRRTDYAVRVLLALAKRPEGTRLPTRVIQEEMLIPRPFLQRIVADLSKAELIRTYAGPHGGLELAQPPDSISLLHIWEAIEGPLLISDCLKSRNTCPLDTGCPVHRRWRRLQALIVAELEAATLEILAKEAAMLRDRLPAGRLVKGLLPVTGH